ncbi:MAG: nucleotide exchange factor GrpE [Bacteroidales bacterium]|nr:nucleotide exchange factor GrpE [Bacteroidales bacterium]
MNKNKTKNKEKVEEPNVERVEQQEATVEQTQETAQEEVNEQTEKADENVGQNVAEENKESELSVEEQLRQQLEDKQNKYLLLAAEFDNYRKRTLKEKAEIIKNGGEKTITAILPVLDDFERALANMKSDDEAVKALEEGVRMIHEKMMKILAQEGVSVIETKDKAFDTDFHEAIALVPASEDAQRGLILDCVQTGYKLNDKVIRHAKVVVGQ